MKTCIVCKIEKENNAFETRRNQCKSCRWEYKKRLPIQDNDVLVNELKCSCCKITKPSNDFMPDRTRLTGLYPYCRPCALEKQKAKYRRQRDKYNQKSQERYMRVRGTPALRETQKAYYNHKMKTDPIYVLTRRLRNRLYCALQAKSWKKNSKLSQYLGCEMEFFKAYIEAKFLPGMSWENQGEWHLDHIIPLDSAETEAELYKLSHYTNIQPLWGIDNIKKGTKI